MIEYLGRMDHQVKVRGFRIELGEIESALAVHPALRENVVIVRQDQPDDKQLIAYIVAAVDPPPATSELRQYLLQKLPDYMVPSAFVLLPALPRLPNGKIDRKTLPAVSTNTVTTATTDKIAPRDELEQRLTRIWERVLSIRPIGVTDNFFDLGGHSLLAVRLFLETRKILNRDLPLATLFQAPTIEQMAQLLRNSGWVAPSRSLVPVQEHGDKPPFFCVHGGGGNVLLFRGLSQHLGPAFPFYALQSQGVDGKREFLTRVEDMAASYLQEIREVQPEGPYYLGGFCMGGSIAYEMAQLLAHDGQEVALLALFDTYNHNGKSPDRSLSSSFSYARQKSRFHLANLRALSGSERVAYLKTKFIDTRRRAIGRAKVAGTNLLNLIRLRKLERRSFIEDINDQAAFAYRPRPYPGKITLFKHVQNYSFFADPQMGWAGLLVEGLNVIEVPASPGGMFVEPYVQVLAARLKASLQAAQSGYPACEWEDPGQIDTRERHLAK
jgi:thioesterase domain-containing protein